MINNEFVWLSPTHTHTLTHTHKDLAWILCVNVLDENRCWTSSIRICDAPSCGVADALRGVLFGSSGKMQGHPIPPVYLHHSLVSVFLFASLYYTLKVVIGRFSPEPPGICLQYLASKCALARHSDHPKAEPHFQ